MLAENYLSQTWLINRLEVVHGLETEKTELSSVLSGSRRGTKAEEIINSSLDVLDDYVQRMDIRKIS